MLYIYVQVQVYLIVSNAAEAEAKEKERTRIIQINIKKNKTNSTKEIQVKSNQEKMQKKTTRGGGTRNEGIQRYGQREQTKLRYYITKEILYT